VIVAGAPAADAPEALVELAERLRAPVFVDGRSKGAIPDDHPLALGFSLAPKRPGAELLARADVVLVIGDRALVGDLARPAQVVQVDWDGAAAGPGLLATLHGHVPSLLALLAEAVDRRPADAFPAAELEPVRQSPFDYARERVPWALTVWEQLRAALPRDALVFTDSLFGLWTARLLPSYQANSCSFPWGTGTLGHAVPAATGARHAFKEREIVAIAGDGAFLYNPQELATMMLYRQKIIVIVANDNCYGAILHNMSAMFGRSIAHELRNPDFLSFGHAFDMASTRLRSLDELSTAVRAAVESPRSSLIEMPLDLRPPRF
jgi:thiamine pyrophosphate-dependent acetolactate synthase large subunit-like protein